MIIITTRITLVFENGWDAILSCQFGQNPVAGPRRQALRQRDYNFGIVPNQVTNAWKPATQGVFVSIHNMADSIGRSIVHKPAEPFDTWD